MTLIIGSVGKDGILVSADKRSTERVRATGEDIPKEDTIKVYQVGNAVYGIAGATDKLSNIYKTLKHNRFSSDLDFFSRILLGQVMAHQAIYGYGSITEVDMLVAGYDRGVPSLCNAVWVARANHTEIVPASKHLSVGVRVEMPNTDSLGVREIIPIHKQRFLEESEKHSDIGTDTNHWHITPERVTKL